ncbi:MAG: DUF3006 domain-containing protein [Dehalococcoidia bacterium]|nr:DUF3006 domain-containing protein [Dehalococcoidia bacterium]
MERACIDRIDEGLATLMVGAEGRELVVPLAALPAGIAAGDWLQVELEGGRLVRATVDRTETARRRRRIRGKLDRLLARGPKPP